jgi:hypothetical protein
MLNPNYAIEITNLPQIIGSWVFGNSIASFGLNPKYAIGFLEEL